LPLLAASIDDLSIATPQAVSRICSNICHKPPRWIDDDEKSKGEVAVAVASRQAQLQNRYDNSVSLHVKIRKKALCFGRSCSAYGG